MTKDQKLPEYIPEGLQIHYRTIQHQIWKKTMLATVDYGKIWSLYKKEIGEVLAAQQYYTDALNYGFYEALVPCREGGQVPITLSHNGVITLKQWPPKQSVAKHWLRKTCLLLNSIVKSQLKARMIHEALQCCSVSLQLASFIRDDSDRTSFCAKAIDGILSVLSSVNFDKCSSEQLSQIHAMSCQSIEIGQQLQLRDKTLLIFGKSLLITAHLAAQDQSQLSQLCSEMLAIIRTYSLISSISILLCALQRYIQLKLQSSLAVTDIDFDALINSIESIIKEDFKDVLDMLLSQQKSVLDELVDFMLGFGQVQFAKDIVSKLTVPCNENVINRIQSLQSLITSFSDKGSNAKTLQDQLSKSLGDKTSGSFIGICFQLQLASLQVKVGDNSGWLLKAPCLEKLQYYELAVQSFQQYFNSVTNADVDPQAAIQCARCQLQNSDSFDQIRATLERAIDIIEQQAQSDQNAVFHQVYTELIELCVVFGKHQEAQLYQQRMQQLQGSLDVSDINPAEQQQPVVYRDQIVLSDEEDIVPHYQSSMNQVQINKQLHVKVISEQYGLDTSICINNTIRTVADVKSIVEQKLKSQYYRLFRIGSIMSGSVLYQDDQDFHTILKSGNSTVECQVLSSDILQLIDEVLLDLESHADREFLLTDPNNKALVDKLASIEGFDFQLSYCSFVNDRVFSAVAKLIWRRRGLSSDHSSASLNLRGCNIGDENFLNFLEIAHQTNGQSLSSFKVIDLSCNQLTQTGFSALLANLNNADNNNDGKGSYIETLILDGNDCCDLSFTQVIATLLSLPSLSLLSLQYTTLSEIAGIDQYLVQCASNAANRNLRIELLGSGVELSNQTIVPENVRVIMQRYENGTSEIISIQRL
ncbi:hypothetical protein MP228_008037 [Amoeboaphelidium protococcarum]|nr:hypothetical protein MP228_008037 [Amoeboaphelidium protococcarum]